MPFRGLAMLKSTKLIIKWGLCYGFAMVFEPRWNWLRYFYGYLVPGEGGGVWAGHLSAVCAECGQHQGDHWSPPPATLSPPSRLNQTSGQHQATWACASTFRQASGQAPAEGSHRFIYHPQHTWLDFGSRWFGSLLHTVHIVLGACAGPEQCWSNVGAWLWLGTDIDVWCVQRPHVTPGPAWAHWSGETDWSTG